jgi:hypothetical protein
MKVYKIRHKQSGLFYQQVRGRFAGEVTNLGPRGRIYESIPHLTVIQARVSDSQATKYGIKLERDEWNKAQGYIDLLKEGNEVFETVEYDMIELAN